MTKYVIYDKVNCDYVGTVYSGSTTWYKRVNDALECESSQEAKRLKDIAMRRCSRTSSDVVIHAIETTETEFDPDAPHTR